MSYPFLRCILLLLAVAVTCGCSAYQPTKDVWKTTKGLWNEYLSPPASVDYEDKGDLPPRAKALSTSMMGIDLQLAKLERTMQNADKPPTQEWVDKLFVAFPWLDGFAGIKNDGTILGQQPPDSLKELDFNPLLYEDKRQNSRALRSDVNPGPLGPEIMLAAPLYDGMDFLGIVVAYFDMRSLMKYSENADDLVVLCPTALLWAGKYDYAATPLSGVDWQKAVRESSAGTCSNSNGSFIYVVRYLGNLPLVFAMPEKGNFPHGNGDLAQGNAFFPAEREKLPPPPVPERKSQNIGRASEFGHNETLIQPTEEPQEAPVETPVEQQPEGRRDSNEIQPGSHDSILLRGGKGQQRQIQERQLEGENVPVERVQRVRRRPTIIIPESELEVFDEPPAREQAPRPSPFGPRQEEAREADMPTLPGGRPSPFGPREESVETPEAAPTLPGGRPSPFGPGEKKTEQPTQDSTQEAEPAPKQEESEPAQAPATLPGGRPSPFGPR